MGAEFTLTTEVPEGRPEIAVLHLGGWLDAQGENKLVDSVKLAREQGARFVLLELRGVSTITSAGIRAIQRSLAVMMPKGEKLSGRLKLCNAAPQVYDVLSITGLLLSVPMYESQDIAIDSFEG